MGNESVCNYDLYDDELDSDIDEQECYFEKDDSQPLFDNRVWTSNVEDIDGGDNFADFCEEFFEMLDEEEYFDN